MGGGGKATQSSAHLALGVGVPCGALHVCIAVSGALACFLCSGASCASGHVLHTLQPCVNPCLD